MKKLVLGSILSIMFVGSISQACNFYQRKQCQANPAQCEASGQCQGANYQDDEGGGEELGYSESSSESFSSD